MAYGTIAIVAIAGIIGGLFLFMEFQDNTESIFICGLKDAPNSIDPLKNPTPKYVNLMVIDQVAEGLFDYDQNQSNTPIVPNLALDQEWSPDYLNFTCNLRNDVKFHDGMPFNATAVKWNFDRIHRFIYTMPSVYTQVWTYLFINPEGRQYINRTEVIDEFTVRFVLNQPYAPLKELFVLWNTYILSPASTPEDRFIDIKTEKLVGTGPYILDSCELDYKSESIKTDFHSNPDYWGGEPSIEKVTFLALNYSQRFDKMISGELSYVMGDADDSLLENYRNHPEITVVSKPVTGIWYLQMNNNLINATMRKAISYALNYTDCIEKVQGNHAERAKSPLPKKMRYANWENLDMPYYNISIAREILKNASWPGTSALSSNDNMSPGNEWELLATSTTPLSIHNFSVVANREFHQITAKIVRENLKQIGVKVNIINMTGVEWWQKLINGELEFTFTGYNAAFLDPVEMINPLYSNGIDGNYNTIHFNDSLIQQWMEEALVEFNETAREILYLDIQQRLVELNPVVWLYSLVNYDIWDSKVKGLPTGGAPIKFMLKYASYN